MERELFTKLERWMKKKNRKPLIIQGARQVGKTWIMKEFGARFYEIPSISILIIIRR